MIQPASRLGETKEYYFSRKLREIEELNQKSVQQVINLGIGSPDLPPAPVVVQALAKAAVESNHHGYQSYRGAKILRVAFANWYEKYYNVTLDSESEILPLIGSKEGIMHIAMTFLEKGDEVLVPNPGYPAYKAVSELTGATPIFYNLEANNNWQPNLEEIAEQDLTKVKIMWVNYPNMPTGADASIAFFEQLIAFAKTHDILIVNDNPYSFVLNNNPKSILSIDGAKDCALELNSLSKSHNMAGWRVGGLFGRADLLQHILRFKSNMDSGMFLPVQIAAAKALNLDESWYKNQNRIYEKRREYAWEIMDLLGAKYDKNAVGLFVWAKVPDAVDEVENWLDKILYDANVFITPGFIFGTTGERYIRISLCGTVEKFQEALERLKGRDFN
ncbi:MAG: LL-diaminopimelate aminotransferase [Cognaticolwellia sp.]|jgi:aspartate/methionine/tyrosine aminotransferase